MSRTRVWLFALTVTAYVAIVIGVVTDSKLVTLDWQVMFWRPYKQWPQIHPFLDYFVVLGQRGPTAVIVLCWLCWRGWRRSTLHPLLVFGTSLLLLNITVGAVKYGLGRLGPHYATTVGSAEMFAGGDIFPSGHTANAVVTWGVLAYLATTPRARRWGSVASALLALGVGATTVYLGTHWVSDVLLGWAAGLLILLALPWFEPAMAKAEQWLTQAWRRLRSRARRPATGPAVKPVASPVADPATSPVPTPVTAPADASGLVAARTAEAADQGAPQPAEPVTAGSAAAAATGGTAASGTVTGSAAGALTGTATATGTAAGAVTGPANGAPGPAPAPPTAPHLGGRPHTGRNDRTPLTPVGSRRPLTERQPVRPAPPLTPASSAARGPRPR